MKSHVPKKKPWLANSPLNSDVDLSIYRAYKAILKHNIRPTQFAYIEGAFYATEHESEEEKTAHMTFFVLRDMGVKYVHCDPWGKR